MLRKLLLIGLLAAIILIVGCSAKTPKIELSTTSYDLGDIDPLKGKLTKTFSVKNTGSAILQITSVSTSCGCTEAEVEDEEIAPGKQTKLLVTYDPSVHPGLTGEITRVIYIQSNDPINEEVELELVGNSLPTDLENDQ